VFYPLDGPVLKNPGDIEVHCGEHSGGEHVRVNQWDKASAWFVLSEISYFVGTCLHSTDYKGEYCRENHEEQSGVVNETEVTTEGADKISEIEQSVLFFTEEPP
jgi:hypothetical protein